MAPFFNDNYRRISVREYARIVRITPPTASKALEGMRKDGLLKMRKERSYNYYSANREDSLFLELSRAYWRAELERSGLVEHLAKELTDPLVVVFGSFAKAEVKADSDIDVAVFSPSMAGMDAGRFERRLGRRLHVFAFTGTGKVGSSELLDSIRNGFVILGGWR